MLNMCTKTMELDVPNWSKTQFFYFIFTEAFVDVCQCCVPKTHSFIPLIIVIIIIALYSIRAEKWCFRKGSEYYVFVKAGNHHIIINFVAVWCLFFFFSDGSDQKTSGFKSVLEEHFSVWWGKTNSIIYNVSPSETPVPSPHCTHCLFFFFCRYLCYVLLACLGMPCP